MTMLILRGIRNRLEEAPAKEYARRLGFLPEVLNASGEVGAYSDQVNSAISRIKKGGITGLYGFSGGGYNLVHLWHRLTPRERDDIKAVVVVGSPGVRLESFEHAGLDVTIFNKENVEHMQQPQALLETLCDISASAQKEV